MLSVSERQLLIVYDNDMNYIHFQLSEDDQVTKIGMYELK